MKVYHAPGTRSIRILWLFEELGLPYELETFTLGSPDMRADEYLKIHPMGRVPALDDGEVTIFESGAIVEYVLAKYGDGALVPDQASPDFAAYLQWLHYAEGMLMPPVNTIVVEKFFLSEEQRNQVNIDRATKLLTRMLGAVEQRLADRDYLAGEFSGADIMSGHATIVADRLGADTSDKPNVVAYIARLKDRPALQAAYAAAE
ncbi:MAG: glutathione S-transferase [Alphaproteobacteria bacterium]|nr:glutathione S-transferase [Alphaproteobacteria bacterium]